MHYDPMIAKLITKGPDRQTALDNLHAALSELQVSFHYSSSMLDLISSGLPMHDAFANAFPWSYSW